MVSGEGWMERTIMVPGGGKIRMDSVEEAISRPSGEEGPIVARKVHVEVEEGCRGPFVGVVGMTFAGMIGMEMPVVLGAV